MSNIEHLQQQLDELQKMYASLCVQIQRLNDSYAIENDPILELKFELQLEHTQAKRDKFAEKIQALKEQIETRDNIFRLRKAVARLNYHDQMHLFLQLIRKSQVGAFVIHGESAYGQSWLLSRLVKQVSCSTSAKIIEINLQSFSHRSDIGALHSQFRQHAGLDRSCSLQEIAEHVHRWWQTQTVILKFYNIGAMDMEHIEVFIQHFWQPLVEKARSIPCPSLDYRLLMFLVETRGPVDTWPVTFAEQIDSTWSPHALIKPPRLTRFSRDVLGRWMDDEFETLPAKINSVQVEDILLSSRDGTPQDFLEYICELCDCDLSEVLGSKGNTYG